MAHHAISLSSSRRQQQQQKPAGSCKAATGEASLFHIDAVNIKSGMRVRMTGYPMTRRQCICMMSKITSYAWRRLVLTSASA